MSENASVGSKTVFLVEDDSSSVDLYSNRLAQAGFKTASILDAGEAREALPNLTADLFIVDLMLHKPGGVQLLEAIRLDARHKDTPILVLSNAYLPELSQRALRAGGSKSKALPRSECTSSELISMSRSLLGIGNSKAGGELLLTVDPSSTEELREQLAKVGRDETAAVRELCAK